MRCRCCLEQIHYPLPIPWSLVLIVDYWLFVSDIKWTDGVPITMSKFPDNLWRFLNIIRMLFVSQKLIFLMQWKYENVDFNA